MFCPRCGVGLSRATEVCSACHADLRPLHATGFFSHPLVASGRTPGDDEDITVIDTAPPGAAESDGETVEGPLEITDGDLTVPGMAAVDEDLTVPGVVLPAAGHEDLTRGVDARDEDSTVLVPLGSDARRPTPTPRARPPSSGTGARQPRTGGASSVSEGPLEVGQMLGSRYHIIRLLGIGGMGAVYQAWDSELEVALAFKVIRPDAVADPVAAAAVEARFKRELLLARQVTHPNVVRIHDLGEIDGMKYITMPYIEGKDVFDILTESKTLPVQRVLKIAKQVASGLSAAHQAGVVHRDLKPANIMIDNEDRALIMDFGIARGTSDAVESGAAVEGMTPRRAHADETRVGTVVGTIEYMAPEQARAEPVDHRVDIYAFGMILYRMLVGRRFAEGTTDAYSDLMARMKAEPTRLREIDPTVPEAVEHIVSKCLQPAAADRYQTTADLLAALEGLDENGIPLPEPLPIWRSWRFWSAAATLMAVLVGGTWWFAQLLAPEIPVVRDPVLVLIADFANGTGDGMFNNVLEQSLGESVETAEFVTSYDRRNALRVAAQQNAGKTLDEKVARVVAQREKVNIVLAGGIVPDGSGYRLSVRGINPADGTQMMASEVRAASKNDVLTAIGRLGADIRKGLGDTDTKEKQAANEMLSAASLEAIAEYIKGQELTRQTRDDEAIPHFKRATEIDPNFGRAYSAWGTAAFKIGRQDEAEAQHKKALSLLGRMTDRERWRTLGVYYLAGSKNYDEAINTFSQLVGKYPSDGAGYNNLAVAYANKLDFPRASENGRKALNIFPGNRLYRSNFALYAMYAGDFKNSADEAAKLLADDPNYFMGYLPLAMAALAGGDTENAREYYRQMAQVNARAASLANIGLADIDIFEGQSQAAIALLTDGIAADRAAKSDVGAAVKQMAIAEANELEGNLEAARNAASAALGSLKTKPTEQVLAPASRIFATSRQQRDIDNIVKVLANEFEPQKRAYGRIVDALDYMSRERYVDAVDSLKEAVGFSDLWLARFYMGVAYEIAGRHTEALDQFDRCQQRRGEATALFIDEVPTYRYLGPLPYWLARAQAGNGQVAQARANYEAFLAQKKGPTKDPLVADARARLAALATPAAPVSVRQ